MSGLKQLRNRIKSIKSTKKITKAMQVVAAAKLRKVKDQAEVFDQYSSVLASIMDDVRSNINFLDLTEAESKFFDYNKVVICQLLIVMTSERGLCGSFNSQIIKAVRHDIAKLKAENIPVKLILIGKKGYDALKTEYADLIDSYFHVVKENYLSIALQLKERIMQLIMEDQVGSCRIYYNEFKNALTQVMTRKQVLPVELEHKNPEKISSPYEYEGDMLITNLINLYVLGILKYGFLQNKASEEAARMTAMDNATRNAGELIDKLTLKLNRSRQSIITTELTEIIAGAEAV